MDPSEALFQKAVDLWRRVRRSPATSAPGTARLSDHAMRLELLAKLLLGRDTAIVPIDGAGGLRGQALLLPREVTLFDRPEENEAVYLYRIAFAAAARELGVESVPARRDAPLDQLDVLLATPSILDHLHATYPATVALSRRLAAAELARRPEPDLRAPAGVLEAVVQRQLARAAGRPPALPVAPEDELRDRAERCLTAATRGIPEVLVWGHVWPPPPLDEHDVARADETDAAPRLERGKRPVVELDRTLRLRRAELGPREDKPLFHVFEKLETAEEYAGQSATPDPSGDVEPMGDALRDLTLGTVVRTAEDPRNLVRAELLLDPDAAEVGDRLVAVGGRTFRYPEWDHRRGAYREGWTTVVEEQLVAGGARSANAAAARAILRHHRRDVDAIRGHLLRTFREREIRDRQTDGPEIDINAMVDRHADLVAGRSPTDRLYLSARRALRDVAILVLVDTSFSADAWLEGRRVLDVAIESLLVLSGALEGLIEEEIAVASFHSNTRNDVRVGILKGFRDPWSRVREAAPGLAAQGYTRIGAALRHGAAILEEAHARDKLLLLLSDGKPTDYDRYEGRHGIEDVARAVREARGRGIRTFGLAIEKEAKLHLVRMLGPTGYQILPHTSLLPEVMVEAFLGSLTR